MRRIERLANGEAGSYHLVFQAETLTVFNPSPQAAYVRVGSSQPPADADTADIVVPPFSNLTVAVDGTEFGVRMGGPVAPTNPYNLSFCTLWFAAGEPPPTHSSLALSEIQTSITNATIPVSGSVDANVTNATIPVSGSVNATITNATLPVSGSIDANITNATIQADVINTELATSVANDVTLWSVPALSANAWYSVTIPLPAEIRAVTLIGLKRYTNWVVCRIAGDVSSSDYLDFVPQRYPSLSMVTTPVFRSVDSALLIEIQINEPVTAGSLRLIGHKYAAPRVPNLAGQESVEIGNVTPQLTGASFNQSLPAGSSLVERVRYTAPSNERIRAVLRGVYAWVDKTSAAGQERVLVSIYDNTNVERMRIIDFESDTVSRKYIHLASLAYPIPRNWYVRVDASNGDTASHFAVCFLAVEEIVR